MPTGYSLATGRNPFAGKKRLPFSAEHRRKMSEAKKGKPSPHKGKKGKPHSLETRMKMSLAHTDEKHHAWKGDKVGYDALHAWVKRKLGRAKDYSCEQCGTRRNLQWSNKDHEYRRNLVDWWVLCAMCHRIYDENVLGVLYGKKSLKWTTRKKR